MHAWRWPRSHFVGGTSNRSPLLNGGGIVLIALSVAPLYQVFVPLLLIERTGLYDLWSNGSFQQLSAFGVVMFTILIVLVSIAQKISKRYGIQEQI
jgi:hypothetical protein